MERKLRKVKNLKDEGNNFWNCCPLKLHKTPSKPCGWGQGKDAPCDWAINSKVDNYCFWKYVKRVSKPDGSMPEISRDDIAKLLNCSSTKLSILYKEAMEELTQILKDHDFDVELSKIDEFSNLPTKNSQNDNLGE